MKNLTQYRGAIATGLGKKTADWMKNAEKCNEIFEQTTDADDNPFLIFCAIIMEF